MERNLRAGSIPAPAIMLDSKIVEMVQKGYGSRIIAQELGVDKSTIFRRMKRLGLSCNKLNQHKTIDDKNKIVFTNEKVEDAAETYLLYLCQLSNYEYCIPSKRSSYDLLVDFGDGFKKVQVKSSSYKSNGNYVFRLIKTRHNNSGSKEVFYKINEVDYFFLHSVSQESWLIPAKYIINQRSVTPAIRFDSFKVSIGS